MPSAMDCSLAILNKGRAWWSHRRDQAQLDTAMVRRVDDPVSTILDSSPEHSDHLPVTLTLQAPVPSCRGRRPWRLPLQLLGDGGLKLELQALIKGYRTTCPPGEAVRRWKECKDFFFWGEESYKVRRNARLTA